MAAIKKTIVGIIIGLIVGLWMGVNIGKKQSIWGNPFSEEEKTLREQAKEKADSVIKDAKKALRDKLKDDEEKK